MGYPTMALCDDASSQAVLAASRGFAERSSSSVSESSEWYVYYGLP